jgi:hypothetical protein
MRDAMRSQKRIPLLAIFGLVWFYSFLLPLCSMLYTMLCCTATTTACVFSLFCAFFQMMLFHCLFQLGPRPLSIISVASFWLVVGNETKRSETLCYASSLYSDDYGNLPYFVPSFYSALLCSIHMYNATRHETTRFLPTTLEQIHTYTQKNTHTHTHTHIHIYNTYTVMLFPLRVDEYFYIIPILK